MNIQTTPARYHMVPADENTDFLVENKDSSCGAAMKRVSLLVDGMARAALLPFGPRLMHRLAFQKPWYGAASELDSSTWSQVAYPTAAAIASYTLGKSLGNFISHRLSISQAELPRHVARLSGIAFALHLFTFGAGLNSVRWLVMIRFLSSVLIGIVCGMTEFPLPEDKPFETLRGDLSVELMEEGSPLSEESKAREEARKRSAYVDVTPATAKIYMTGFALSIITGGLLYRHASTSYVYQAFTGGYAFTLTPLFFGAVSVMVEFVLRCVFDFSADGNAKLKDEDRNEVGPVRRLVGVVNRRVRISETVSARSPDSAYAVDREEENLEFYDPLSLSKHSVGRRGTPNRSRLDSTRSEASMSEFFDCNSAFSDEVIDLDANPHTTDIERGAGDIREQSVTDLAGYKDGRCVYPDGSPAFVTQGDSIANVPQNYIDFCRGNTAKAAKMWKETQAWRKEKGVWNIHRRPHPLFGRIKEAYPHIIHGHSKTGQVVVYEHPGKMNLKQLFRSGCHVSDMLEHLTFFLEYVGNCVGTRRELRELNGSAESGSYNFASWGTMVVMDIQGCSITSLTGDVMKYLSQSGKLQSNHYPNVLRRVFVVNCPFFVAGAWSMVKGIVPESVHVEILSSSNALEAMRKYIDDDQIPPEYGGSSPYALGEHPYEVALTDVVQKAGEYERDNVDLPTSTEPIMDSSFSFDHNEQRMVLDDETYRPEDDRDVPALVKDIAWRTEMRRSSSSSSQPFRRRISSDDAPREELLPFQIDQDSRGCAGKRALSEGEGEILSIVSAMYIVWCAVQGAVETAVPLWLLSPAILGGLGYTPSRSGMALFCSSVVVLWLMRTKVARVVSQIPNKAPMRAFRIATGSEAALMALLPLVPSLVSSTPRTESVLVMTSTIIFLSCTAVASMLGRSGMTILHRIASSGFSRSLDCRDNWFCRLYGGDKLLADCESGRFSLLLRLTGEVLGVAAVAPLYAWSTAHERPAPFDASCAFVAAALVSLVLYICSFSLHLNVVGEFAPHPTRESGCGGDKAARRCCSFAGEIVSASVGDMASLFEEANWSSSPVLGFSRGQSRDSELEQSPHRLRTKSV